MFDLFNNDPHLEKPRIGISSCLLGNMVRFNGMHGRDRFITDQLSRAFDWVPVCPEVGSGMGVPREPVRLVGEPRAPRLLGSDTGTDYTAAMLDFSEVFLTRFEKMAPHGFILKKKSPSCGLERIPVYHEKGGRIAGRDGLFAAALKRRFPHLPIEEDGRLNDLGLREHFIGRVYAYKRWCDFKATAVTPARLVQFHTEHKLILTAHAPDLTRELGRLVAAAGDGSDMAGRLDAYGEIFMKCFAKPAGVKGHANVLYRLVGYLKHRVASADRHEILHYIERFREAQVPLSTPLVLLAHHLRKIPQCWSVVRHYLQPYPRQFSMRFGVL